MLIFTIFVIVAVATAITGLVLGVRRRRRLSIVLGSIGTVLGLALVALILVQIETEATIYLWSPTAIMNHLLVGPFVFQTETLTLIFIGLLALGFGIVGIALKRTAPSSLSALEQPDDGRLLITPAPLSERTNPLSIAAIIVVFFSSLVGLILGHIALSQIKRTGERGRGMALAAVVIGWCLLGVSVILTVVFISIAASTTPHE